MTISKEMKIPTIDFCKLELKSGSAQLVSTRSQVVQALKEYGCFLAIYDKVSKETREAIFDKSKEIFEFPLETKMKNFSTKNPLDGYKGQFPQLPLYESLCIADLVKPQTVETFANIFWPHGNPDFFRAYDSYAKPLVELDEMIKRMVLESLELNDYIDELLDNNVYNSRFSHYKKAAQNEDALNKLGLTIHTDSGFLTMIAQNSVNGLEVLTKDGEWIDVDIAPNSFFVLSGDSFMAWTNGRLHSPAHRVTMAGDSDRFSIPLFSAPKPGYTIEAPKELVDEEHPLLFKPFEILELFEYITRGPGRKAGADAFKDYCGV
ncbi:probable 2-oxoglutarate-dependent dioxygenase AOP1 [Lycium ferocissimum]|uniref:probable 2-oxoglutarate-dependent dioxygenase AOP1 n=1 Tax=Lycium ferocissimum TaxID=112874 RepID=UPI002815506B|nr:probable 2-oxoglutarate-dependent dioxygenase AOP1 [Lycium ferocissimum]